MDVVQLLTQVGGGGQDAAKGVKNLLEVMSENGRLGQLNGVVSAFEKIMRAHKGEVDVIVTSAQPLEANVLRRLEQSISKSPLISKGQRVKMQNKVHFLLGGITEIHLNAHPTNPLLHHSSPLSSCLPHVRDMY